MPKPRRTLGWAAVATIVLGPVQFLWNRVSDWQTAQQLYESRSTLLELLHNPLVGFGSFGAVGLAYLWVRYTEARPSDNPDSTVQQSAQNVSGQILQVGGNIGGDVHFNAPLPSEIVTRSKYSKTHTLTMSSEPFGVSQKLDIDGAGRLLLGVGVWSNEEVDLGLPLVAPLEIENPDKKTEYKVGQHRFGFPQQGGAVKNATFIGGPTTLFKFNYLTKRTNVVEISNRKFKITLESIRDLSGSSPYTFERRVCREYTFSVVEQ